MKVTLTILVDREGNVIVHTDADEARSAWENDIGGFFHRELTIDLDIEVPAPTKITATVPAHAGNVAATIKA